MQSIGKMIDELFELRENIRKKTKEVEDLKGKQKDLEAGVMDHMDREELPKASGKKATVSIIESVVPSVVDWDAFWNYIFRNKASHLMERRAAATAYREELEARKGKPIPGVQPYTKRTPNLRKV